MQIYGLGGQSANLREGPLPPAATGPAWPAGEFCEDSEVRQQLHSRKQILTRRMMKLLRDCQYHSQRHQSVANVGAMESKNDILDAFSGS